MFEAMENALKDKGRLKFESTFRTIAELTARKERIDSMKSQVSTAVLSASVPPAH